MARSARPSDYDAIADPYCYPDTTVLINIPDIRDGAGLARFEAVSTAQRADEPLPRGLLSVRHYRAVHHHLFQDVYAWAGKFRTVRLRTPTTLSESPDPDRSQQTDGNAGPSDALISAGVLSKNGNPFCYPEHIGREMKVLFASLKQQKHLRGLSLDVFAPMAAHFLATLNAIHPFREGNGRTQMTFLALLAAQAEHRLALERLEPDRFLAATIRSFHDDEQPLAAEIHRILEAG